MRRLLINYVLLILLVPIGFIYVQLSGQPEPSNIWPTVTWTEITSEYAGLFFRALGSGSASFGYIQAENSPRLTEVSNTLVGSVFNDLQIPVNGGWSSWISTGSTSAVSHWALQFLVSTGEVRPRNSAIRIWKRSQ